ncbi:MAG: HD-GYP domain-containing protein [Planctomycetes bacterium]|nr:HD-GYP domain-containing protein [Planctomycetota bacterium]
MSDNISQYDNGPVYRALRQRCSDLGLPTWHCDVEGRIIAEPDGFGEADVWFTSPQLRERIESAWRKAAERKGTGPFPLLPGGWMLPLVPPVTCESSGNILALAMEPGAGTAQEFSTICGESGLDVETMRVALAPFMTFHRDELERLHQVLQLACQDQFAMGAQEFALNDLSRQLSFVYEQINTLYQFGRSMNNLEEPKLFAQSICNQLLFLLEYNWIAVQYVPSKLSISGLEHELFLAGKLTCDPDQFTHCANELISSWTCDQWTCLLETDESKLAALSGSQIVVEPISHDGEIIGAIFAGAKGGVDPEATSIDVQLLDTLSDFMGVFHQNAARFEVQRSLFTGTVRALSSSIDAKDPYTRGHSDRVAHLAKQLAQAYGMSTSQVEDVYITGLLHDVGKIGVPEATLLKVGTLTDEEFEQIKQHPVIGYEILKDIPPMADMLPGVLHHHESWDGEGYPNRLKGNDIPLLGRLLAVADAFDAMSSDRAYRAKMPREKVLQILKEGAGSQWDAQLVKIFFTLDLSEFDKMIGLEDVLRSRVA